MTRYVLALDQGTSSSRALLFDREGRVQALAQKEVPPQFPRPGWVEHDPGELWSTQIGVAQEALARAGARPSDVAAIGITNQRETTLLWDRRTGEPLHRAIVWQDRRTAPLCAELRARGLEDTFRAKTGLLLDPYFSGTKLRWLLDHVPGARERAERGELAFGTVDSWLVWQLTGGELHVTDATNASRTLLYNLRTGDWDDELLGLLEIPRALLPEVRPSSEVYGHTAAHLFGHRIPVAGIAGDQQAATFGQACLTPGMAKNTYGTGCFLLLNTGTQAVPSGHRLLTTVAWDLGAGHLGAGPLGAGRTYALEGSVFVAGAAVGWLRDGLGLIREAQEVEALAASVPTSGGVYFVPAFVGLGAPYWDPHARGTLVGLTRGTTGAHLARAALEATAFQSAEVLLAMRRDHAAPLRELRVDGGGSRNALLMQIQADLLGVPVVRPRVTETTALGAALLAGLAVGFWDGVEDAARLWQEERVFEPALPGDEREHRLARWRQAVERSRGWAEAEDEQE